MAIEYIPIKGENEEYFLILENIPAVAKEYGWTSGLFDKNLADAIEKARNAEEDPFNAGQDLLTALYTYQAMQLARDPGLVDAKAVRRLEKLDDSY